MISCKDLTLFKRPIRTISATATLSMRSNAASLVACVLFESGNLADSVRFVSIRVVWLSLIPPKVSADEKKVA